MHIASRKHTSHFEGSKKELSLKTIKSDRNNEIKQTLSESGPESLLASHGKYARTRTFALGQAKRAVLAFSEEKQRVDGFVVNKDQQLVLIQPHDLPKELRQILNSDAFEAFLKDVHARLIELSNGDFRLDLHQGLKGGVYRADGDINEIRRGLEPLGANIINFTFIIENQCSFPIFLKSYGLWAASFYPNDPKSAFLDDNDLTLCTMPPQAAGGFCAYRGNPHSTWNNFTMGAFSFSVDDCTVMCGFRVNGNANKTINVMCARIQIKAEDGIINGTETPFNVEKFFESSSEYTVPGDPAKYFFENTPETRQGRKIVVKYEYHCPNQNRVDFIFRFGELNTPVIPREIRLNPENTLVPAAQNQDNRDINAMLRQLAEGMNAMQNMLNTLRQTP